MLLFIEGYPYVLNDIVKDGLTVRDVGLAKQNAIT